MALERYVAPVIIAVAAVLCGCEPSVPDGRIRIKNDFFGEEYSTIEVSGGGASYTLKSRESALLPKGTTNIHFTYAAKDSVRRYQVSCPDNLKSGITIKLIDVHVNRIAGKCETVYAKREKY